MTSGSLHFFKSEPLFSRNSYPTSYIFPVLSSELSLRWLSLPPLPLPRIYCDFLTSILPLTWNILGLPSSAVRSFEWVRSLSLRRRVFRSFLSCFITQLFFPILWGLSSLPSFQRDDASNISLSLDLLLFPLPVLPSRSASIRLFLLQRTAPLLWLHLWTGIASTTKPDTSVSLLSSDPLSHYKLAALW